MNPRPFLSIAVAALRLEVDPESVWAWAIEGRIGLSAIIPRVQTRPGVEASGIVGVAAEDVFGLAVGETSVAVRRVRLGSVWHDIADPAGGVPLRAGAVVITRAEVLRFEGARRGRSASIPQPSPDRAPSGGGRPNTYDWDAFTGAVARRVHEFGMPETRAQLIDDMCQWFEDTFGAQPDESLVRRKVNALWPELTRP